jgi:hypothetical protein
MKKFRKPRDDGRFALTTLQNPTLEVRGLRQLIATAEQIVAQEAAAPDALPSDDTPPPNEVQLSPEKTAADDPLPERGRPSQNCSPPKPLCRKTPRPSLNHPSCLPTHQIRNRAESAKLSCAEPRGHRARKPRKTAPVSRPRRELTDLERKCAICQHPDRDRSPAALPFRCPKARSNRHFFAGVKSIAELALRGTATPGGALRFSQWPQLRSRSRRTRSTPHALVQFAPGAGSLNPSLLLKLPRHWL